MCLIECGEISPLALFGPEFHCGTDFYILGYFFLHPSEWKRGGFKMGNTIVFTSKCLYMGKTNQDLRVMQVVMVVVISEFKCGVRKTGVRETEKSKSVKAHGESSKMWTSKKEVSNVLWSTLVAQADPFLY